MTERRGEVVQSLIEAAFFLLVFCKHIVASRYVLLSSPSLGFAFALVSACEAYVIQPCYGARR